MLGDGKPDQLLLKRGDTIRIVGIDRTW